MDKTEHIRPDNYAWPFLPIAVVTSLVFFALIPFLQGDIISGKLSENGLTENIALLCTLLAIIFSAITSKNQNDLVLHTVAFSVACLSGLIFLSEMHSCESDYDLGLCLYRWIKYPAYVLVGALLLARNLKSYEQLKTRVPEFLKLEFLWPVILVTIAFGLSQYFENTDNQYNEEMTELFAQIFIAIFAIYLYVSGRQKRIQSK